MAALSIPKAEGMSQKFTVAFDRTNSGPAPLIPNLNLKKFTFTNITEPGTVKRIIGLISQKSKLPPLYISLVTDTGKVLADDVTLNPEDVLGHAFLYRINTVWEREQVSIKETLAQLSTKIIALTAQITKIEAQARSAASQQQVYEEQQTILVNQFDGQNVQIQILQQTIEITQKNLNAFARPMSRFKNRTDTDVSPQHIEGFKTRQNKNIEYLSQLQQNLSHLQGTQNRLSTELDSVKQKSSEAEHLCAGLKSQIQALIAQRDTCSQEKERLEARLQQRE